MRKVSGIAIVAAVLSMAGAASAEIGDHGASAHGDYGTVDDPRTHHDVKARNDPETFAEDLRRKGRCEEALPILRNLANGGSGYEISQYNLGLCLIDLAAKDPQHSPAENKEGADFILQAANAGFGKAQAVAVGLYLDGTGVGADPVEAGKWAFVYHENGMRLALGLPDLAPDMLARLNAALSGAKRTEAHARANTWTPSTEAADR